MKTLLTGLVVMSLCAGITIALAVPGAAQESTPIVVGAEGCPV